MKFCTNKPAKQETKGRSEADGQTRHDERGAALVEYSVISLVLISLIFGAIELSLAWSDTLVLDQATRSGSRVGARMTNDAEADREVLRAVVSNLDTEDLAQVEFVVVYQAASDGSMPVGCLTSSSSACNRYPQAALGDLGDDSKWGCVGSAHDSSWCPTGRDPQLHSPVNLGVYIEARRPWITSSLPGGGIDLSSDTVMRLDPLVR